MVFLTDLEENENDYVKMRGIMSTLEIDASDVAYLEERGGERSAISQVMKQIRVNEGVESGSCIKGFAGQGV